MAVDAIVMQWKADGGLLLAVCGDTNVMPNGSINVIDAYNVTGFDIDASHFLGNWQVLATDGPGPVSAIKWLSFNGGNSEPRGYTISPPYTVLWLTEKAAARWAAGFAAWQLACDAEDDDDE